MKMMKDIDQAKLCFDVIALLKSRGSLSDGLIVVNKVFQTMIAMTELGKDQKIKLINTATNDALANLDDLTKRVADADTLSPTEREAHVESSPFLKELMAHATGGPKGENPFEPDAKPDTKPNGDDGLEAALQEDPTGLTGEALEANISAKIMRLGNEYKVPASNFIIALTDCLASTMAQSMKPGTDQHKLAVALATDIMGRLRAYQAHMQMSDIAKSMGIEPSVLGIHDLDEELEKRRAASAASAASTK